MWLKCSIITINIDKKNETSFFAILIFIFLTYFFFQISNSKILMNDKWNDVNNIYRNCCFLQFIFCDIFRNIESFYNKIFWTLSNRSFWPNQEINFSEFEHQNFCIFVHHHSSCTAYMKWIEIVTLFKRISTHQKSRKFE